ncbi:HAD family hydrolase [Halomonas korlensis]|uniref:Haloacid dehalogenase superfamily, subfamily IA, variant 3 with third motif having DD or ED/haloacid dehalogenase superfamily, subfamily IA, variant 1 with third motif having Dx(3-4)D or Dx(3-4)E n=1 Tax=Halomonas korlensis TaxID=463301 RepID=A0A1I7KJ61_9GAMM|nr:HAD-IA family hydrolase [Halomonas korlensis]SFU97475.1 haloacid dehalogenase superfamily, subfamily IA, variant 3 with third motif having DD or ED/haloacid dehalogenase superfamily, subfamily IA, variant 1 with third motif having Dx(3-4)D or Dx(3-4)E [Halomonas korlensis]
MSPPLCLLFDSDGTLVDSEFLLAEVMEEILPAFGLPFSAQQYMEEFRGVRFLAIVLELEPRHQSLSDPQRDAMEAAMRDLMEARMREHLRPIVGMREALERLQNYPCGVVSNGPERKIRCAMESVDFTQHFGGNLFSAYTFGVWKPDPVLYLKAAEAMGYPAERCVVIDDAAVGVEAGLKAGMQVIHLNHFPDSEITPDGAIALLHAKDLPQAVARLAALLPA